MAKINLILFIILAFFTMQVLAQAKCRKESTASAVPTATVTVRNFFYEPNCLTVHDGTFVEWGIFLYIII